MGLKRLAIIYKTDKFCDAACDNLLKALKPIPKDWPMPYCGAFNKFLKSYNGEIVRCNSCKDVK
jgi:hypothetical protein